jgi:hypothetical protein
MRGFVIGGSGALDHVAFTATDPSSKLLTLGAHGIRYRELDIPASRSQKVFVEDPSEVTIELNFPAAE